MSATNRKAPRGGEGVDFFSTPTWCVRRLLEAVPLPVGRWLEPGVGDGAIVRAVNAFHRSGTIHWTTCDVRPGEHVQHVGDFLDPATLGPGRFDVVIGNPPYRQALDFVMAAIERAPVVAMLLRLGFLEGQDRADWLRSNTPSVYVLPNRPSFTGKGTDATAYAWMVWAFGTPTISILGSTTRDVRGHREVR